MRGRPERLGLFSRPCGRGTRLPVPTQNLEVPSRIAISCPADLICNLYSSASSSWLRSSSLFLAANSSPCSHVLPLGDYVAPSVAD